MLIACKLHLIDLYSTHFLSKKREVVSPPDAPQYTDIREVIKIYPGLELAVEVIDPKTNERIRAKRRADWQHGYSGRDGAGHRIFLVAMETKPRDLFSTVEPQFLTYLAITRERRIRIEMKNSVVQWFYTDGCRCSFMAINADGELQSALTYNVMNPEGGKTIFNFI